MLKDPFKNHTLENFKKSGFWSEVFRNAVLFFLCLLAVSWVTDDVINNLFELDINQWSEDYWVNNVIFKICMSIGFGLFKATEKKVLHRVPKMANPPAPPEKKKDEIKALYEYLETRALNFEGVKDLNPRQAFPLWINIEEVYSLLSMHYHGELPDFLKRMDAIGHYEWGCDAYDHNLPEFPAEKSKKYA